MSYTIYDIAKEANVSIATVSRVFNDSSKVSKATRDKVLTVAKKAGYHPQGFAQGLASRKNNIIMAVVPVLSNYFFMQVLAGIQDKISEFNYELYIYNIKPNEDKLGQIQQLLRRKWAAAYLMVSVHLPDREWTQLKEFDDPITLVDDSYSEIDSIYVDNVHGAEVATQFLLNKGYLNPGMILPNRNSKPAQDRLKGFNNILSKYNIKVSSANVVTGETNYRDGYNEQNGYEAMQKILSLNTVPDACFCSSDIQAVGAMGALREAGVNIPIIGYDDIKIAEYLGLSTISQPMYRMGEKAVEHIIQRIDNPEAELMQYVFPTELIERTSTEPEFTVNKSSL